MDDLIQSGAAGLISLFHQKEGVELPKPFSQEVFLYNTYVAGTSHVPGIEELEPYLGIGDRLTLLREPENPFDNLAVLVKNADGVKLGYVPRRDNAVFARLMDAGKLLFAKLTDKECGGGRVNLFIDIYLQD